MDTPFAANTRLAGFGEGQQASRQQQSHRNLISTQNDPERQGLVRRAYLVGMTAVGLEATKFGRALDYLSTLPFVDKDRFAFYGMSNGGYTAMWIAPLEPRFKVVICSGHFNDWDLETTDLTGSGSFLLSPDDLNHTTSTC